MLLILLLTLAAYRADQQSPASATEAPPFAGTPYIELNSNVPVFIEDEIAAPEQLFEAYAELNKLGRRGVAAARI